MKFLLFIIIVNVFAPISCSIVDPLMKQLLVNKFVLPDEDQITAVDLKLLVRISLPSEGLKGKIKHHSNSNTFIRFKSEDNQNFIITKLNNNINSFQVRDVILNFNKFWHSSKRNDEGDRNELIIICSSEIGRKKPLFRDDSKSNDILVISIGIEEIDSEHITNKTNFLDAELSHFLNKDNSNCPLMKIFNAIKSKFIYYKNQTEDVKATYFFFFKDTIKISPLFADQLVSYRDQLNNTRMEQKVNITLPSSNKVDGILSLVNGLSNYRRDFVSFKNELSKEQKSSTVIIDLDPDDLVRNYVIHHRKLQNNKFKLDLENVKTFLKNKYHIQLNTSEKILLSRYLQSLLKSSELREEITDEKILEEFELIYEKFFHAKFKHHHKHQIKSNHTVVVNNHTKPKIIEKVTIKEIKYNFTNITQPKVLVVNNTMSIRVNNTVNNTMTNPVNNSMKIRVNNTVNNTMTNPVNNTVKIIPTFNSNITNTAITANLAEIKHSHYPRILKNEKIRYVNGSLLLIQTMLLPGVNEDFAEAKDEFNKIIKSGLK